MNSLNPYQPPAPPPPEEAIDAFAARWKVVRTWAIVAGIVGAAFGLVFAVGYVMTSDNINLRGTVAMPFVCGGALAGMVGGVALLFAPAEFFTSPQGRRYLEQIGTRSVFGARVVILICLLIGCGFIFVLALGALQLLGILPPGSR